MELVPDAPPEVDDAHIVVPPFGDQLLDGYLFTGKERAYSGSLRNIIHTYDMHCNLLRPKSGLGRIREKFPPIPDGEYPNMRRGDHARSPR